MVRACAILWRARNVGRRFRVGHGSLFFPRSTGSSELACHNVYFFTAFRKLAVKILNLIILKRKNFIRFRVPKKANRLYFIRTQLLLCDTHRATGDHFNGRTAKGNNYFTLRLMYNSLRKCVYRILVFFIAP